MAEDNQQNRLRPIIRVFVSSTFSDMKHERNALAADAFPKLEQLCQLRGFQFQAIDLRWGVSTEAGLDHRTMRICFEEVRRAQEVSPRPNFLILLGNRYGWRPLPEEISVEEFHTLELAAAQTPDSADKPAVAVLREWYREDTNAVPPVYLLQPRSQDLGDAHDYTDDGEWNRVQDILWTIINRAMPPEQLQRRFEGAAPDGSPPSIVRFQASATEQEIWHGALRVPEAREHVLAYFREIENAAAFPDPKQFKDFVDVDPFGRVAVALQTEQVRLKTELQQRLGSANVFFNDTPVRLVEAQENQGRRTADVTTDHLAKLCTDVVRRLSEIIQGQIEEYWRNTAEASTDRAARELEIEQSEYEQFAKERGAEESLVGRQLESQAIHDYLRSSSRWPLVVHGASGCGKTGLLARAWESCRSSAFESGKDSRSGSIADNQEPTTLSGAVICARFIGVAPRSSDLRSLLSSLCQELRQRNPRPDALPTEVTELRGEFIQHLQAATPEQPLILFLDALDQLTDADNGLWLNWLPPSSLPVHVKLVVTCLSDRATGDPAGQPYAELNLRQIPAENFINLDVLSEAEARLLLFERWLPKAGRKVGDVQRARIEQRLVSRSCRQPIYLKLLFEEVRLWRSYDPAPVPGESVSELLGQLFARLSRPTNHGPLLVDRVLGYLSASRHGLAENEILEILFADPEHRAKLNQATEQTGHELPPDAKRIPIALWSRLRFDLAHYLTEQSAIGANVLTWYHRQVAEWARSQFVDGVPWNPHGRLANFFETSQTLRSLTVLAYHLSEASIRESGNHASSAAYHDRLYTLMRDDTFRRRQVAQLGGYPMCRGDLELALRLFAGRTVCAGGEVSAEDAARLCWLALKAGRLASEIASKLKDSFERWQRPNDVGRVSMTLDGVEVLDDEDLYLAGLLLIWIEADRQAQLPPGQRNRAAIDEVIRSLGRIPPESLQENLFLPPEATARILLHIRLIFPELDTTALLRCLDTSIHTYLYAMARIAAPRDRDLALSLAKLGYEEERVTPSHEYQDTLEIIRANDGCSGTDAGDAPATSLDALLADARNIGPYSAKVEELAGLASKVASLRGLTAGRVIVEEALLLAKTRGVEGRIVVRVAREALKTGAADLARGALAGVSDRIVKMGTLGTLDLSEFVKVAVEAGALPLLDQVVVVLEASTDGWVRINALSSISKACVEAGAFSSAFAIAQKLSETPARLNAISHFAVEAAKANALEYAWRAVAMLQEESLPTTVECHDALADASVAMAYLGDYETAVRWAETAAAHAEFPYLKDQTMLRLAKAAAEQGDLLRAFHLAKESNQAIGHSGFLASLAEEAWSSGCADLAREALAIAVEGPWEDPPARKLASLARQAGSIQALDLAQQALARGLKCVMGIKTNRFDVGFRGFPDFERHDALTYLSQAAVDCGEMDYWLASLTAIRQKDFRDSESHLVIESWGGSHTSTRLIDGDEIREVALACAARALANAGRAGTALDVCDQITDQNRRSKALSGVVDATMANEGFDRCRLVMQDLLCQRVAAKGRKLNDSTVGRKVKTLCAYGKLLADSDSPARAREVFQSALNLTVTIIQWEHRSAAVRCLNETAAAVGELEVALQAASLVKDNVSAHMDLLESIARHAAKMQRWDEAMRIVDSICYPATQRKLNEAFAKEATDSGQVSVARKLALKVESNSWLLCDIAVAAARQGEWTLAWAIWEAIEWDNAQARALAGMVEAGQGFNCQEILARAMSFNVDVAQHNEVMAAVSLFAARAGNYSEALEAAGRIGSELERVRVLGQVAVSAFSRGDRSQAASCMQEAFRTAEQIGRIGALADVAKRSAEIGEERIWSEALELALATSNNEPLQVYSPFQSAQDDLLQGLTSLINMAVSVGRYEKALAAIRTLPIRCFGVGGFERSESFVHDPTCLQLVEAAVTSEQFTWALAVAAEMHDEGWRMSALALIAKGASTVHDADSTGQAVRAAIAADQPGSNNSWSELARAAHDVGLADLAAQALRRLLALGVHAKDSPGTEPLPCQIAEEAVRLSNLEVLNKAVALAALIPDPGARARSLSHVALMARDLLPLDRIRECFAVAVTLLDTWLGTEHQKTIEVVTAAAIQAGLADQALRAIRVIIQEGSDAEALYQMVAPILQAEGEERDRRMTGFLTMVANRAAQRGDFRLAIKAVTHLRTGCLESSELFALGRGLILDSRKADLFSAMAHERLARNAPFTKSPLEKVGVGSRIRNLEWACELEGGFTSASDWRDQIPAWRELLLEQEISHFMGLIVDSLTIFPFDQDLAFDGTFAVVEALAMAKDQIAIERIFEEIPELRPTIAQI